MDVMEAQLLPVEPVAGECTCVPVEYQRCPICCGKHCEYCGDGFVYAYDDEEVTYVVHHDLCRVGW